MVGCYDNAIAVSLRNFPESFNPEHLAFLPKRPTAVLPDQQGSYMYVATETSVHALSVAPSASDNPMILQTVWSDTGIARPHNWCSYEGVIFAFVSRQGAVTMDALGRPSSEFALPVARAMRDWDIDKVCVFPCPDLNSVVYTHEGVALLFNVQNRKWSAPVHVSDYTGAAEIVGGVVIDRRLQLSLLDTGDFKLYEFDEDDPIFPVRPAFAAVTPDVELNPAGRATVLGLKGRFHAGEATSYSFALYCDYSGSASKTLSHLAPGAGMQTTLLTRWNLPRKESVRVAFTGSQSDFTEDCYPVSATVFGVLEDSNKLN